jgi:hypothetical protein
MGNSLLSTILYRSTTLICMFLHLLIQIYNCINETIIAYRNILLQIQIYYCIYKYVIAHTILPYHTQICNRIYKYMIERANILLQNCGQKLYLFTLNIRHMEEHFI